MVITATAATLSFARRDDSSPPEQAVDQTPASRPEAVGNKRKSGELRWRQQYIIRNNPVIGNTWQREKSRYGMRLYTLRNSGAEKRNQPDVCTQQPDQWLAVQPASAIPPVRYRSWQDPETGYISIKGKPGMLCGLPAPGLRPPRWEFVQQNHRHPHTPEENSYTMAAKFTMVAASSIIRAHFTPLLYMHVPLENMNFIAIFDIIAWFRELAYQVI